MSDEIKRLQELNAKAVAALKLCKAELKGWIRNQGPDLDTQEAIIAAELVIQIAAKGV